MAMIITFSASTSSGSSATAIVIAAISIFPPPVSQASQKPDSKCRRFLAHRLRSLRIDRSNLLPVQPVDRAQCARFNRNVAGPIRGQQNCASSSVLANRHTPVPSKQTALIRSAFRAEHVERAIERVATIPNQRHQADRPLEVNRHARYVNLHPGRDHALRTARIASASRSGSTSPPARTTTSPITPTVSLRIASKRVNLTGRLSAPFNGATTPEAIACDAT